MVFCFHPLLMLRRFPGNLLREFSLHLHRGVLIRKETLMMTTVPLLTCCDLLHIDPKTLRKWLRQAQMPLYLHPTDERVKCLTMEQVQRLAALHGRALAVQEADPPSLTEPVAPTGAEPVAQLEGENGQALGHRESTPEPEEAAWLTQLAHLEAQVTSLQQQLAHLRTLASLLLPAVPIPASVESEKVRAERLQTGVGSPSDRGPHRTWTPHPGESRRSPVLPLIEYGAAGRYVLICPHEGELPIVPDSPEWFSWLASLSSFRFVGKQGRFSACREYDHGPKRTWEGYRCFHQHMYKHYLGTTEHLTIATLEQMAATLQSEVASL
jgi:hypothetical protein